ncbi:MAG: TraB/GumN family protein [Erythrobacter sp.]
MIKRIAFLAAAALALASCGDSDRASDGTIEGITPSPILYEVSDSGGESRGWVFGTIHTLPPNLQWRTDALDDAINNADSLIVEIAGLEDSTALFSTFNQLATTPGQPDIGERVPPSKRPELFALVDQANLSPSDFGDVETWAAALILAQASDDGQGSAGADRVILGEFEGRPILELEGAQQQLGIFDQLPESEQEDLLLGVIEEEKSRAEDPGKLRRAWLAGDEAKLIEATNTGLMADPELRAALLVGRNNDWIDPLVRILNRGGKPLVAVGAAHVVGPDGLPELLKQRGYRLRRVQ